MSERKPLGPWTELGRVLATKPKGVGGHPGRSVLLAHLKKGLHARPERWTEERARDLLTGSLQDWTEQELAAHLVLCRRCRKALLRLQSPLAFTPCYRRVTGNPRVAWALAGVQALALVAVFLWFTLSPAPKPTIPEIALPSGYSQSELVKAELVPNPQMTIAQFNELLKTYGMTIVSGPDEEGGYVVLGRKEALEEISTTSLVESIIIIKGR